jgi:hypothetical protein
MYCRKSKPDAVVQGKGHQGEAVSIAERRAPRGRSGERSH